MRLRDRVHAVFRRRDLRGGTSRVPGIALAATVLAGCASNDGMGGYIVDPGHYSAYHCKDFGTRLTYLQGREQQLRALMDKASEGSGGELIGNLSYRAEYEDVLGEEKVLRRSAAEKNCELPPPAAPPSPAAAVAPAVQPATATPTSYQSDQSIR